MCSVATSCGSPLAPALSFLHYFRGSFKELRGEPRRGWFRNNLLQSTEKTCGSVKGSSSPGDNLTLGSRALAGEPGNAGEIWLSGEWRCI